MRETEAKRGREDDLAILDYVIWDFERNGREGKEQADTVARIEANQARRSAERASRRPTDPAYWLILKNQNGLEVLTLDCQKTLPVFSHEEEAEMFLRFGGVDDGWGVRESGAGELISVLCGLSADVKVVALDPLPEMVAERTVGLVSLGRGRFIECITARRRAPSRLCEPGRGSSPHEGQRHQRNEANRIAAPYPPGRLA